MNKVYVHGYDHRENTRLQDQASTLVPPTYNGLQRFIGDLVQDTIADEDELHQAVSKNAA